jgi:hypothetical protein
MIDLGLRHNESGIKGLEVKNETALEGVLVDTGILQSAENQHQKIIFLNA